MTTEVLAEDTRDVVPLVRLPQADVAALVAHLEAADIPVSVSSGVRQYYFSAGSHGYRTIRVLEDDLDRAVSVFEEFWKNEPDQIGERDELRAMRALSRIRLCRFVLVCLTVGILLDAAVQWSEGHVVDALLIGPIQLLACIVAFVRPRVGFLLATISTSWYWLIGLAWLLPLAFNGIEVLGDLSLQIVALIRVGMMFWGYQWAGEYESALHDKVDEDGAESANESRSEAEGGADSGSIAEPELWAAVPEEPQRSFDSPAPVIDEPARAPETSISFPPFCGIIPARILLLVAALAMDGAGLLTLFIGSPIYRLPAGLMLGAAFVISFSRDRLVVAGSLAAFVCGLLAISTRAAIGSSIEFWISGAAAALLFFAADLRRAEVEIEESESDRGD